MNSAFFRMNKQIFVKVRFLISSQTFKGSHEHLVEEHFLLKLFLFLSSWNIDFNMKEKKSIRSFASKFFKLKNVANSKSLKSER